MMTMKTMLKAMNDMMRPPGTPLKKLDMVLSLPP